MDKRLADKREQQDFANILQEYKTSVLDSGVTGHYNKD